MGRAREQENATPVGGEDGQDEAGLGGSLSPPASLSLSPRLIRTQSVCSASCERETSVGISGDDGDAGIGARATWVIKSFHLLPRHSLVATRPGK